MFVQRFFIFNLNYVIYVGNLDVATVLSFFNYDSNYFTRLSTALAFCLLSQSILASIFLFLTSILALLLQYISLNFEVTIQSKTYNEFDKLQLLIMNQNISSDRLIAHHRSRQDYTQSPQNALTFGYGDHRYVKFTYELLNESDTLKTKILKQLIQDFSSCQSIDLSLKTSDLLSVLLKHIGNHNDEIRSLSIKVIRKICISQLGRRTIVKKDCILTIQKLIHDKLNQIRLQTYEALIDFAQNTDGIQQILLKNTILQDLVNKLVQQKVPQILQKTVLLLANLMQGQDGTPKALKTQIIARLMNILDSSNSYIQVNILRTLSNISFNYQGKEQIIKKGYVKKLCGFVESNEQFVRRQICLLLCSLAQLNQGKIQILNFCQFDIITSRLDDSLPETVLNTVQLIANLAENPLGREKSQKILNKIDKITSIDRKYVDATLDVIKWKP